MRKDLVNHAINAASDEAALLICNFAAQFDHREDYEPLEALAREVQAAVVETACQVLRSKETT